ncbi:hypothetical protein [Ectothiorhodospira lacustris]|uniref:hypothetical protein n=1 Tax=Ectothiorhodospira lacustris TaxID=2899127 RepID=UPI001EE8662B|nr:hypothetical protein [Ectothiorhodospira lacustris]MCG5501498.1 hypothetical protein [Ectothiorhodospira lacustris]MCG5509671.1 hypothetical protein [Ectothiorhodospira lacustris]MCG5523096.1 hypothetical protein [Ectothiorhodospira lacustris]
MNDSGSWTLWLLVPMALVAGIGITLWATTPELSLPERSIIVHVQNRTDETIPTVEIGYANVDTEQHTTLLQLRAGETRTITLNHEPGLGYNIEAHLADGRVLDICGGRHPESRVMREVITRDSILSGIGQP